MRIWSLHPKYLDSKGLVALWRESLLAKAVLTKNTRGYKNHPQLIRFKNTKSPEAYINVYLHTIFAEAESRGYHFNKGKLDPVNDLPKLKVSDNQIKFEYTHLLKKLYDRSKSDYISLSSKKEILPHPLFEVTKGEIEPWEVQ